MTSAATETPDRIFVSQASSANIVEIDSNTGKILAHVDVGMLPHNMVVSADRRSLYVALVGSQAIADVDLASMRLRRTMLTAAVPVQRADGSTIDAHRTKNAFGHSTCYDCHRPGGVEPKYAGVRPFGLLLSPDGKRLLVSHLRSTELTVLDLQSGKIRQSVQLVPAGNAQESVALARLDNEIWVAMRVPQPTSKPGVLRRLDEATFKPIDDRPIGADPGALLALPDNHKILVSNFESDSVTEYAGLSVVRHKVTPGPLGLTAITTNKVLALDYYSNAVSILDLVNNTSQTLHLEHAGKPYVNPTNAVISSDGRSAWIVTSGTNGHVLKLDLASNQIALDVPIDGLAFGIALVPGIKR